MRIGDYEVLNEIARGAQGVVYRARNPWVQTEVAIKVLVAGRVERFMLEARILANLQHPNLVRVLDVGEVGGRPYLVMDLIEGESLQQRLDRTGTLDPHEAAKLTLEVARALEYVHAHGVLHRDLKPANILLTRTGTPLLTDFGLAYNLTAPSELSKTGASMGTPGYWPPEQALAQHADQGPASDVYSLGATLYAALTGQPPFAGDSLLESVRATSTRRPVRPSVLAPTPIDKPLERICLRCLEKDPARRYRTAAALVHRLEAYLEDESAPVARGRPLAAAVWTATALLVLGMLGLAWTLRSGERTRQPDEAAVANTSTSLDPTEQAATDATPSTPLPPSALPHQATVESLTRQAATKLASDPAGAIVDYQAALELDPDNAAVLASLGAVRASQGDMAGALLVIERSIALDPSSADAHYNWASVHVTQGDLHQARIGYDRALEVDPNHASSLLQRGLLRSLARDWSGALTDYQRVLDLEPQNRIAHAKAATAHHALGRPDLAIAMITKLIELTPEDPWGWANRGALRLGTRDLDGALADTERAVELEPSNPRYYFNRGQIRRQRGEHEAAVADYGRALVLDPHIDDALRARAKVRSMLGDTKGTIDDYDTLLEHAPDDAEVYAARAALRYDGSNVAGALEDCNRALALEQKPSTYVLRAAIHYREGRHADAIDDCDRALALGTADVGVMTSALTNRAAARYHGGDAEGAIADCDRAISLGEPTYSAYLNRAAARLALEDRAGARADLQQALEILPEHDHAGRRQVNTLLRRAAEPSD